MPRPSQNRASFGDLRKAVRENMERAISREKAQAEARRDEVLDILRVAVASARRAGRCGRAWLFGSYAWGSPGGRSDVDLLVEDCVDPDGFAGELGAVLRREVHVVQANHAPVALKARAIGEAALVALALDHACQAFETLLLRLERAAGLPERNGETWHGDVLEDAALAVPGLRPSVYPEEARSAWRALLRFRHFLRHAYLVDLDAGRLRTNRERLDHAVSTTSPHVEGTIKALLPE